MAHRSTSIVLILVLAIACVFPSSVGAHIGYAPTPIFTFSSHPDFPFEDYAQGHLGIVLPTYDDLFLYIAYRNLSGASFTPAEIKFLQSMWEPMVNSEWKEIETPEPKDWGKQWIEARSAMMGSPVSQASIEMITHDFSEKEVGGETIFFQNCQQDAFRVALETLAKRKVAFGPSSSELREWAEAQDAVFSNCPQTLDPSQIAHIPTPPSPSDSPLFQADRSYQIAAAYFYAGQFEEARWRFDLIAKDEASPWRGIAPYLAVRATLRKGTLLEGESKFDPKEFAEAEKRLDALLAMQADLNGMKQPERSSALLRYASIQTTGLRIWLRSSPSGAA